MTSVERQLTTCAAERGIACLSRCFLALEVESDRPRPLNRSVMLLT